MGNPRRDRHDRRPGGGDPVSPKRRSQDRNRWAKPVCRRDLVAAFALVSLCFGGTIAYALSVQETVKDNQCVVLNRLAETKLVIAEVLEDAAPDKYEERVGRLKTGISELTRDVDKLNGCRRFAILSKDSLDLKRLSP